MTGINQIKYVPILVLSTWFLGNLGIHFLLPFLPDLAASLQATSSQARYTITFFLAGKSAGMLFYGPLSEVYGRRRFMLAGLVLYCLGALCAALAPAIGLLMLCRFIQGLGVSATILMGRVIINDSYQHNKAASVFGYLFAIAALIITILPALAGLLAASAATWRVAFGGMFAYSLVIFFIILKWLPETRDMRAIRTLSVTRIIKDYMTVLKSRLFLGYLLCTALMVAGESAFNTSAAFLLIRTYGVSTSVFGVMMTSLLGAHLIGAAVCGKYVVRKGISSLTGVGALMLVLPTALLAGCSLLHLENAWIIISAVFVYFFGTGFIMTTAAVGVVQPFPDKIGTAMAFALFLEFLLSSLGSFISGSVATGSALTIAVLMVVLSLLAFSLWLTCIRPFST